MTLTDAQRETIRYFELEVVEQDYHYAKDWLVRTDGALIQMKGSGCRGSCVVVRPAHVAKVAAMEMRAAAAELRVVELEAEIARLRQALDDYGCHKHGCGMDHKTQPCTCGFTAARQRPATDGKAEING